METDSDPDADDPYARGRARQGAATAPRRSRTKVSAAPAARDVGERVDSGDDSRGRERFEGYDDDAPPSARWGAGGGLHGGGGADRAGSSSGGTGRWFTKNGRRVYKVGGREFTGSSPR